MSALFRLWAGLCSVLAGIWYGLCSAVRPRRRTALPASVLAPRRGLGEDGETAAPCAHRDAESVNLGLAADGERVAWWCEECKTQLPPEFDPAAKPVITCRDGGGSAGGGGQVVAVYREESPAPARYVVTGSWRRRHWHEGSAGCAGCAGADASGASWCLCGRCIAAAAASVMGP